MEFPTILDFPAPHVRSYPRETVVAEKYEAMVKLGMFNTRMKDFFDLWTLSNEFSFDGTTLSAAIKATFETRGTAVPSDSPLPLTSEFYEDRQKNAQWNAFLKKSGLTTDGRSLPGIVTQLIEFLMPVSTAVADSGTLDRTWQPGGPWNIGSLR